ncbi:hypothetical protein BD413DRAFT_142610 [Trametes elegans]|nr:hypothetical protein BD413DRAFT_142610 [Trametes elegans]
MLCGLSRYISALAGAVRFLTALQRWSSFGECDCVTDRVLSTPRNTHSSAQFSLVASGPYERRWFGMRQMSPYPK